MVASIQGARRIMSLILIGWATTMGACGIEFSIFTKQFNRARPSFRRQPDYSGGWI
jgi:hypothetical protein